MGEGQWVLLDYERFWSCCHVYGYEKWFNWDEFLKGEDAQEIWMLQCVGEAVSQVLKSWDWHELFTGVNISAGSDMLPSVDQPASFQQSRPASRCQWCLVMLSLEDFCENLNFALGRKSSSLQHSSQTVASSYRHRLWYKSQNKHMWGILHEKLSCVSARNLFQGWFLYIVFHAIRSNLSESIYTML